VYSVLIRFYFNDIIVTPDNTASGVPINVFHQYFMNGYEEERRNTGNDSVVNFLGADALAIDSVSPLNGFISENAHPGVIGLENNEDPTFRAVVISYRIGKQM